MNLLPSRKSTQPPSYLVLNVMAMRLHLMKFKRVATKLLPSLLLCGWMLCVIGCLPDPLVDTAKTAIPDIGKTSDDNAQSDRKTSKKDTRDRKDDRTTSADKTGDKDTPVDPDANDKKAKENAPTTTFNAKEVSSHYQRAKRVLKEHYTGFLKQQALGFDQRLPAIIWSDIQSVPVRIERATTTIRKAPTLDFFLMLLPLVIAIIFMSLLSILDRQLTRWCVRWQSRQYPYFLPRRMIAVSRVNIWLTGLLSPPLLLIGLSYFPIRAIFGEVVWTILLTQTLWLIFATRAIVGLSDLCFGLVFTHIKNEDAQTLQRTISRFTRVMMFVAMPWIVASAFQYHGEIIAFCAFAAQITLAILLLLMFWSKNKSIVALFPDHEDASPLYKIIISTFETQFHLILLTTSALLIMLAFGYQKASSFLLYRGYGLFLLVVGVLWLTAVFRQFMHEKQEEAKQNRAQSDLLRSIRRLLTAGVLLVLTIIFLELFLLFEPIVILLKTPLLTIQSIEFSIFNLLSAGIIVGTAALVSLLIRVGLNAQIYPTFNVDIGVAYAINTIINYLIIVVGFFLVLIALGVNLAALTVVVASLSVGIGFGLQTLTENLISGLILLFGRAVQKGDYITVKDIYGRVEAVGARSVVVRTMDNYDMLIPSKELVNGSIINWSYRDPYVRLHIPVGVTYDADPKEVERVLLEAAKLHEDVLKVPEPQVWFTGFGDSAINFALLVYFDCNIIIPDQLKGQIYFHIWDKLAEANIKIPFPQRDLHLKSVRFSEDDMNTLRRLREHAQTQPPDTSPSQATDDASQPSPGD